MACSLMCSLHKHEDPSSIHRTHIKGPGMKACAYNSSMREAETGEFLGLTILHGEFQDIEIPCLRKQC